MQQGRCKNNSTSGQYCKHDRGQGHSQDSNTNSRAILSGFHCAYIHPGLSNIKLDSHPLKGSLIVHSNSLAEYNVDVRLLTL